MEERIVVEVPNDLKGLVIGRRGSTLRNIQDKTGAKIEIKQEGAYIRGSKTEVQQAKEMIQSIIQEKHEASCSHKKKEVNFPIRLTGLLIGPGGATILKIQKDTKTKIKVEGNTAYITGPTQEHVNDAERKINDLVSGHEVQMKARKRQYRHKCEKFALVDGKNVAEDNYFKLEEISDANTKLYKLVLMGDKVENQDGDREMNVSRLKETLLKVLHDIRKETQESGNVRTDMWCHFGHIRIQNVDEADAGKTYELQEINDNLQATDKSCSWQVLFRAGVEELEFKALEKSLNEALEGRPLKVSPNTRFDYTFYSPTGHQIRFKAFVPDSNAEDGCFSFQDDLVPIKNALASQSSDYKYRLCAPSSTRLKVDLLIPYRTFDCHLILRTTMREVKDVSLQEEDKILIDFLDKNLKFENGQLVLPMDELPSNFTIRYIRESKRRTYPYSLDADSEFNVTISEEKSQEESQDRRTVEDEILTKTDIHVHCDEWDELLDKEDWEPEAIVNKLPDFLDFLREVQANIQVAGAELELEEDE